MSVSDSEMQRADPIDVRVAEVWPAVDRLQRAAGAAKSAAPEVVEFANATAEAVAAVAHLAHDSGRGAQLGQARCSNCPASEKERTRRQQRLRDLAAWSGVGVALLLGILGMVLRLIGM